MLWGISWINVEIMLADAARIKDNPTEETGDESASTGEVVHRELKTKEDIKNYLKGMM